MGKLSQVQTGVIKRPPRIVVHGKGGVGKTTFGAAIPHVVFLPAEEGEGVLDVARLPRPHTFEDVMNTITELATEEHPYKAFVIDTIDKVEPLLHNKVCRDRSKGNQQYESIEDFGYQKGFVYADNYWITFFQALDVLRQKGMTTVILSHCATRTIEDPQIGSYEGVETKLHKRANALLHEWADLVGYAEMQRSVKKNEEGKRDVRQVVNTGNRVLHLEDTGGILAKNRYRLPNRMPLDWQTLREALIASYETNGSANENPTPAATTDAEGQEETASA